MELIYTKIVHVNFIYSLIEYVVLQYMSHVVVIHNVK